MLWAALSAVGLLRLAELAWATRNTRRLLADGGTEAGRSHYPLFILLHGGWLGAMAAFIAPGQPPNLALLLVFIALQAARLWVILSLGRFWTTRIITIPGMPLVRRGPYRYCRHPNYLVVTAEIAVLPLAFGNWQIALIFSLLNGALLAWRIRVEEKTLAPRRSDQRSWNEDVSAT